MTHPQPGEIHKEQAHPAHVWTASLLSAIGAGSLNILCELTPANPLLHQRINVELRLFLPPGAC